VDASLIQADANKHSPTPGKGWVDLEAGVLYRRAAGKVETNKRQTPIRIPPVLLRHLRKWKRLEISKHYVVEFNGQPVKRINKGFRQCPGARRARRRRGAAHTQTHLCDLARPAPRPNP
jgi:hypothetical protein